MAKDVRARVEQHEGALSTCEFRNVRDYLLGVKRTVSDRLVNKLGHLLPDPVQDLSQKLSDYENELKSIG